MDNQSNQNIENNENAVLENSDKGPRIWVSLVIACLLIAYIAAFCTVPLGNLIGFAAFAGFAVVYSSLITSGSLVCAVIPPFVGLAAAMISEHLMAGAGYTLAMQFFNVPVAVAMGAALYFCNRRKAKKSVVFATVSVFGTLSLAVAVIAAVYIAYGALSSEILSGAVADFADAIGDTYKEILTAAAADIAQNAEVAKMIDSVSKSIALSMELNFVSILAVYGMMFGAFTVIIYKPIAKLMGCEERIFKDRDWIFSLSGVSAVFFEIIFAVYVFSVLLSENIVILGAFINLVNVLVYPFGYVGIKYVYGLLKTRMSSGLTAALIIAAVALVSAFVTGLNTFVMVAALVGSSSVFKNGINPKGNDSDDQI